MAHATDRMEIRLSPTDKAMLTEAAATSSLALSAFVRRAVLERAEAVLSLARSYTPVPSLAFEQLVNAIPGPGRPHEALRRAAERLDTTGLLHDSGQRMQMLPLDSTRHWTDLFSCPDPDLTEWLRRLRSDRGSAAETSGGAEGPAQCWVWVPGFQGDVLGFYTLGSHRLVRSGSTATREQGLPAVLLRRLAVSSARGRSGTAALLVADALRRAVAASDVDGSRLVVVEALTPEGRGFWEHFGFVPLPGTDRLAQRMADVRAAVSP